MLCVQSKTAFEMDQADCAGQSMAALEEGNEGNKHMNKDTLLRKRGGTGSGALSF